MKNRILFLSVLLTIFIFCIGFNSVMAAEPVVYGMGELVGTATDYSDEINWLHIPSIEKEADTIYFYPTVFEDPSDEAPVTCAIDSEIMRIGAAEQYTKNALAFEKSTNVFAPFYQQLNLAKIPLTVDFEKFMAEHVTRTDAYAALDYYFENYNNGRPFILAGHSQGSQIVRLVLKDYMQVHPEYYERMIAAYVIGYSVTQDDLDTHPYLRFAEGETDTGVIVSWNIEGEGNGSNIVVLDGAISINPINWKRDETYAPASDNLGDHISNSEGGYDEHKPGLADARVDLERGVVICTSDLPTIAEATDASAIILFGAKSFHNGDYDFYFRNIEDNAMKRVASWFENK